MAYDTEIFLEKVQEIRPIVIFTEGVSIFEVYIPEGESSPEYLLIECGEDESCETDEHDTMVEILEGAGYILATPSVFSDFVVSLDDECDECDIDED